jgi:hypothetical protein
VCFHATPNQGGDRLPPKRLATIPNGRGTETVVGLTGVPHQETDAFASGNGRSVKGPYRTSYT